MWQDGRDAVPRRQLDMKCIGGRVLIIGNKFSRPKKLYTTGHSTSVLYVKTARMRFSALENDGVIEGYKNKRTWAELELPDTHVQRKYRDMKSVVVHDIVLMAAQRILE